MSAVKDQPDPVASYTAATQRWLFWCLLLLLLFFSGVCRGWYGLGVGLFVGGGKQRDEWVFVV